MDGKQVINASNPNGTGKYLDERGVYVTLPAGGTLLTYATQIDLGNIAKYNHVINVVDSNVTLSSNVKVSFNHIDEKQDNDLEFNNFNFKTTSFDGGFNLFVFSESKINKKLNIVYTI